MSHQGFCCAEVKDMIKLSHTSQKAICMYMETNLGNAN